MRIVAIAVVLLSIPIFFVWLQGNARRIYPACVALGFLPFGINALNLDAALINWAMWPGYAKGMILTGLDALALAIVATRSRNLSRLPFRLLILSYLAAAAITLFVSPTPMATSFYAFQLLRVFVLFLAVASIASDPKAVRHLAYGLAAGIALQAVVTINQKIGGAFQAAGTMGHQNLLGMMTHFVALPLFALLLGGERSKIVMIGFISAVVVIVLGASRGTVGFAGLGLGLLIVLSLVRRSTPHKWRMVGFAAVAVALSAPMTVDVLQKRIQASAVHEGEYDERAAFERAARAIIADHPMGIGANMYVVVANSGGYSARAGVVWNWASRSTNVHNAYLLVAAETGWLGLIALIGLLAVSIVRGLAFAFSDRRDPRGDLVLGASVALIALAAHNLFEWVFVMAAVQYMAAIALGLIAGSIRQRNEERRLARRAKARSARLLETPNEPSPGARPPGELSPAE